MRPLSVFTLIILTNFGGIIAHAQPLEGVYNTGPSLLDGARSASINIEFHPCTDDASLSCASVVKIIEPEGPSGETTLPDGNLIVGYTMVSGLKSKGDGKYRGGKIAALDESMLEGEMKWYGVRVDNQFDGTLIATGCLGFICPRKMIWRAVEADIADDLPDAEARATLETASQL